MDIMKNSEKIMTGFRELDALTGGIGRGTLCAVGGRPGMGRKPLELNIAVNAALRGEAVTVLVSGNDDTSVRQMLLAIIGGIDLHTVKERRLSGMKAGEPEKARETLEKLEIRICTGYRRRLSAPEMKKDIPRLGGGLLILLDDDIGLSGGREYYPDTLAELRLLAKEENCAVLFPVGISRSVEHRVDRHPLLSDVREVETVSAFADTYLLIYRDSYYNEGGDGSTEIIAAAGTSVLGKARLVWDHRCMRFSDEV